MKSWIKAGLVGGILGVIVSVTTYYKDFVLGDTFFILLAGLASLILYFAVGIWAVSWSTPPPPSLKEAIWSGALAGLLSALIVAIVIIPIMLMSDSAPPLMDTLFSLRQDQTAFIVILATVKTTFRWILLSALSGFVYAAVKKERK